MKFSLSLTAVAALGTALVSQYAYACDALFVQSVSKLSDVPTVSLNVNTVPADTLSFPLSAGSSRIDDLAIGTGSPDALTLSAHITDGNLSASCQVAIANQNNTTPCSGVIDPRYVLVISSSSSASTSGGSTDTDTDDSCHNHKMHHDNGKHIGIFEKGAPAWGFRRQLKGGQCDSDNDADDSGSTTQTTTAAALSCQFMPVTAF